MHDWAGYEALLISHCAIGQYAERALFDGLKGQKGKSENFYYFLCFGAICPAFSPFCSPLLILDNPFILNNLSQK